MINIESNIYHAGLIAEAGDANSYFVHHKGTSGNWLINSPKPTEALLSELRELGGVKYIFVTHRDVVSYVVEMAAQFNALKIIHLSDIDAMPDAEIVLQGQQPSTLANDSEWLAVPTPGHTEGHCMLLYANKFLFSGDAIAICRDQVQVEAPEWTWQNYELNIESVRRLSSLSFSRILPDHGDSIGFNAEDASARIATAVELAQSITLDPLKFQRSLEIYIEQLRGLNQKVQLDKMLAKLSELRHLR